MKARRGGECDTETSLVWVAAVNKPGQPLEDWQLVTPAGTNWFQTRTNNSWQNCVRGRCVHLHTQFSIVCWSCTQHAVGHVCMHARAVCGHWMCVCVCVRVCVCVCIRLSVCMCVYVCSQTDRHRGGKGDRRVNEGSDEKESVETVSFSLHHSPGGFPHFTVQIPPSCHSGSWGHIHTYVDRFEITSFSHSIFCFLIPTLMWANVLFSVEESETKRKTENWQLTFTDMAGIFCEADLRFIDRKHVSYKWECFLCSASFTQAQWNDPGIKLYIKQGYFNKCTFLTLFGASHCLQTALFFGTTFPHLYNAVFLHTATAVSTCTVLRSCLITM